MSEVSDDAGLIAGPRGRRLCWALLQDVLTGPAWSQAWQERVAKDAAQLSAELADALASTSPSALFGADSIRTLLIGLDAATRTARYWQEPDGQDQALALPEVARMLEPIARAVAAAAPAWWSDALDLGAQRVIDWADPEVAPIPPPSLTGAVDKLATWRADTVRDEQRAAQRPADVRTNVSGHWWSSPALSGLPTTTRALPGFGAAGLMFIEDGYDWRAGHCIPVAPQRPVRVYEIRDARDWVELVSRYPLEVTLSRRHDWWRAAGAEGRWLIPDYQAVSRDFDAVHLTTCAYLAAAGVAHEVGTSLTLLAGWHPDQTYWLTDCLSPAGQSELWVQDRQGEWIDWALEGASAEETG